MKLSKFLSILIFITSFSLLYVYQQTEIFRLAYVGQKQQSNLQELLDKNANLRYNIQRNGSLVKLGGKIGGMKDFQMPDSYRLVRITPQEMRAKNRQDLPANQTLLSRLFGIKRQAEAKTINP